MLSIGESITLTPSVILVLEKCGSLLKKCGARPRRGGRISGMIAREKRGIVNAPKIPILTTASIRPSVCLILCLPSPPFLSQATALRS